MLKTCPGQTVVGGKYRTFLASMNKRNEVCHSYAVACLCLLTRCIFVVTELQASLATSAHAVGIIVPPLTMEPNKCILRR